MPTKKADLLIVKPGSQKELYGGLSKSLTGLEPPLWAALLAAFVRKNGFKVEAVDVEVAPESFLPAITGSSPRFIAIVVSGTNPSASTMNMVGTRAILQALKAAGIDIPVILMGLHPSALPERTLKEEVAPMVCEGEGFYTLSDLLSGAAYKDIRGLWYRESGEMKSNPRAELINPNDLPPPAWDLFPMDRYRAHNWHSWSNGNQRKPYGVIYTSLGCPFHCSFCCINSIFGINKIRFRDPELVVEDIDCLVKNYGIKNIKIIDEMFAYNESRVIKLCDLIIERNYGLNFWAYGRVDTISDNMVKKMKEAGINWLAVGFESGSKKIRDGVVKGRFKDENIRELVGMIKDAGINIVGNFIFGLPDDDHGTMQDTLNLAKELNCEYTNFYVCMAYPGSRLYKEVNPVDLPGSWLGYSQLGYEAAPLPTRHLRAGEVLRFRDEAFNELYESEIYQKMIYEKFGEKTLQDVKNMLGHTLKRRILGDRPEE